MPARVAAGRPPGLPEGAHAKRGGARRRRASRPPSDRRERGAAQPRRQAPQGMPGVQPGKSGGAALAAREAAPEGALRGAQGAKPAEGPPARCRRDCPHRLPRAQTQSRCAIRKGKQGNRFSAHWTQKKPPQQFLEPATAVSARLSAGCAGKPSNAALCALFRLSAGFGFTAQHAGNGAR